MGSGGCDSTDQDLGVKALDISPNVLQELFCNELVKFKEGLLLELGRSGSLGTGEELDKNPEAGTPDKDRGTGSPTSTPSLSHNNQTVVIGELVRRELDNHLSQFKGELIAAVVTTVRDTVSTHPNVGSRVDGPDKESRPTGPHLMTITDYAHRSAYSKRTVETFVKHGLPTVMEGRLRRVIVNEADEWLRNGGPQDDDDGEGEIEREAREMARKSGKNGR